MTDLDRPRLALYVALGVVVCVLGARYLGVQGSAGGAGAGPGVGGAAPARSMGGAQTGNPAEGASAATGAAGGGAAGPASVRVDRADGGRVTVHVAGAVRRPGLYRLRVGSRIDDAIRRAGGPAPRADITAVNLATKLEDGRQVLVPERPAPAAGTPAPGPAGATAPPAGAAAGVAAPAGPVSLNTATLEQLDTLDGVGPGIAQRIIDYREQHGGFRRVEELGEVPGIGPKRLASLTAQVTL